MKYINIKTIRISLEFKFWIIKNNKNELNLNYEISKIINNHSRAGINLDISNLGVDAKTWPLKLNHRVKWLEFLTCSYGIRN